MSRRSVHTNSSSDVGSPQDKSLEVIQELQASPPMSSARMMPLIKHDNEYFEGEEVLCTCKPKASQVRLSHTEIEQILQEKETELREEYDRILQREKEQIKDRFNLVLLNEQTRASYMLREAHRERQEKIRALQTQLQCKNLAALMYVICTERKRSRFEKLQIVEDFTNYINTLNGILVRGQQLILHLSRGYKTAARVDYEWREKMKKVVSQFLSFIYHYAGGDPETNQYLIDLPKLLKTEATLDIDPNEDPCDCDDDEDELLEESKRTATVRDKEWWEDLDSDDSPFIMFGDLADFQPKDRREVLKSIKAKKIKAKKIAPKEWKELCFNEMYLNSKCVHLDKIKSMYQDKLPVPVKWECLHSPGSEELRGNSKMSIPQTNRAPSLDIRGTMGSILKMITLGPTTAPIPAKTELLGARDSMEIVSVTRLASKAHGKTTRSEIKSEHPEPTTSKPTTPVTLNIGKKRASVFVENGNHDDDSLIEIPKPVIVKVSQMSKKDEPVNDTIPSALGSTHTDSLHVIHSHHPEPDHTINYERVCPMEKCQHMQMDSFMRSLPPYMTANPFTHFEQSFEEYETCSPEQLEMLKQRIEIKKGSQKEPDTDSGLQSPLSEWFSTGVGVQTSDVNVLPPCTCHTTPPPSLPDPKDYVLNLAHLDLVKQAMDAIEEECLFDDRIQFDRFKLIGKDTDSREPRFEQEEDDKFKTGRHREITEILTKHPSLLDIFQANAK